MAIWCRQQHKLLRSSSAKYICSILSKSEVPRQTFITISNIKFTLTTWKITVVAVYAGHYYLVGCPSLGVVEVSCHQNVCVVTLLGCTRRSEATESWQGFLSGDRMRWTRFLLVMYYAHFSNINWSYSQLFWVSKASRLLPACIGLFHRIMLLNSTQQYLQQQFLTSLTALAQALAVK